ncbi:MAG TPA: VIT family protein [Frateuria sp.]|uniref:VIT1/CCC1 transporter family protein n=1 Tax=Frateuria sp. TaxID=2211372 RepID=UPI002DEADB97|nr:VIT family protein [Frateuria sp.]
MRRHRERHRTEHTGWLRAAVLGANDGIVSTASLVMGVAAAHTDRHAILLAGVSALVAGAMSMAAGEYVSVHSQWDSEEAELAREREELANDTDAEHRELASIYVGRGLDPALARQVAEQLMAHDALDAHARDELGITEVFRARPLQAAAASAASFAVGSALPLLVAVFAPLGMLLVLIGAACLVCLVLLGAAAARMGGASMAAGAMRIAFWSLLAMLATAGIGHLFGTATAG